MTIHDLAYTATEQGLNIDLLLNATQIDRDTFALKMYNNEFNSEERKIIRQTIENWEMQNDLK